MKAVNIILCILVLVLALASAVFSYFLFEKRTEMLGGWEKLAVAVNRASTELDKNSGTRVASELSVQAIGHKNYASLDSKLAKFTSQSRQIVAERDALADALVRIGRSLGVRANEKALREIPTYADAKDRLVREVISSVNSRNKAFTEIAEAFNREYRTNIDGRRLSTGDQASVNTIKNTVKEYRERRENYESRMRSIGSRGGLNAGSTRFTHSNYRTVSQNVGAAVDKLWRDRQRVSRELSQANARNRSLERQVEAGKRQIAKLNETIKENQNRFSGYKRALGIADDVELPMPWADGSAESRSKVAGKVIKVNAEYGYIVIDLGLKTVVKQTLGNRTLEVNPKLAKGFEMVIARGEITDKADFIARVTLDEVGDECSTANIPVDCKDIKVGDSVFFGAAK